MLPTQRHHQLLVRLLLARLVEHAHVGLTAVERFAGFAEAAGEAVVNEGVFEDAFQSIEHAHAACFAGAVGCDFHLVRCWDLLLGDRGLFSVRLGMVLVQAY